MKVPSRLARFILIVLAALLPAGCNDEVRDWNVRPPVIRGIGNAVAVDAAGNSYVVSTVLAEVERAVDLNPRGGIVSIELGPGANLIITRFNANGTFAWAQNFSGRRVNPIGRLEAFAIVAGNGRVYVAGMIGNPAGFGEQPRQFTPRAGSSDAFVLALDAQSGQPVPGFGPDGAVLFGGRGQDEARALVLSTDGATLFAGGAFRSTAGEPVPLPGGGSYTPKAGPGFVLALDALSGAARAFGADTNGDGVRDGVVAFDGPVEALAATSSRLYALGDLDPALDFFDDHIFDASIVALDAATGTVDSGFSGGVVAFGSEETFDEPDIAIGRSLAVSSDGQTVFAAGIFAGKDFGFDYSFDINSADDAIDADDVDTFIYAVDAATGAPQPGFGRDTTGDGQGDGIAVLDRLALNLCRQILVQGDSATGSIFLLANSPDVVRNGVRIAEPDVYIAKLSGITGTFDTRFSEDGIQSFGGDGTDNGAGFALLGDRLFITGGFSSLAAGVGGPGDIAFQGGDIVSAPNHGSIASGSGFLLELSAVDGEGANAGPRILTISPTQASSPSPGFPLTVHGRGFAPNAVVLWEDEELPTSVVDARTLTASVPGALLDDPGRNAAIVVHNPDGDDSDDNDVFSNGVVFAIVGSGAPPVLTQIDPPSLPFSSRAFRLTIAGSGFERGAVARIDGEPRPTTVLSATELVGFFHSADVAESGVHLITASNPGSSGSNVVELVVGNPIVTAVSPATRPAGSPGFILDVIGERFSRDAEVILENIGPGRGGVLPTTFVSSSLLRAELSANDLAEPRQAQIRVRNRNSGLLNSIAFTIAAPGPEPFIFGLNPSSVLESPGFELEVLAGNFAAGAEVLWNGAPRPTASLTNPERLRAQISGADVQAAGASGSANVAVRNPSGAISAAVRFIVGPPSLAELAPASAQTGGDGFTLVVAGSRFALDAEVLWNGAPRATTYFSPNTLAAVIPAGDISQPGEVEVRVMNRFVADSNPLTFTIGAGVAPAVREPARVLRVRDRDRDGFIDDLERFLGSSPSSAASTPPGFRTPPRIAWVAPLAPQLKTVRTGRRRLVLSGRLPLPANYGPEAEPVYVFTGGRVRAFELNAGGASPRDRRERFRISLPRSSARESIGEAPFILRLECGAAQGPVLLRLGDTLYQLPDTRPR